MPLVRVQDYAVPFGGLVTGAAQSTAAHLGHVEHRLQRRNRWPHPGGPSTASAVLIVVLVVALGVAGCASRPLDRGECVVMEGDGGQEQVRAAGCGEPGALRVLEVRSSAEPCHDVPAVTRSHEEFGAGQKLCLGPPDADPGSAINTAQAGDCLAPEEADGDLRVRVDCADPRAESRVVHRVAGVEAVTANCVAVPGATAEYEWRLKGDGLGALSTDVVSLCLGPAGADPASAIELARPGDCVADAGGDAGFRVVGCVMPEAEYLVLERIEGLAASVGACEAIPEATGSIRGSAGPGEAFTLCVAAARG